MEGFVDIKVERWFTVNTNLAPVFSDIADIMLDSVLENFASGGRPSKWTALIGGETSYLYQSGRLRQSLQRSSNDTGAELSTDVPYARWNQFGAHPKVTDKSRAFFWYKFKETKDDKWKWMALTQKTKFDIPERPFMVFQEDDKKKILEKLTVGIITFTGPDAVSSIGTINAPAQSPDVWWTGVVEG